MKEEMEDSVLDANTPKSSKGKKVKRKVEESSFLKVPKNPTKKKRETIELKLDDS